MKLPPRPPYQVSHAVHGHNDAPQHSNMWLKRSLLTLHKAIAIILRSNPHRKLAEAVSSSLLCYLLSFGMIITGRPTEYCIFLCEDFQRRKIQFFYLSNYTVQGAFQLIRKTKKVNSFIWAVLLVKEVCCHCYENDLLCSLVVILIYGGRSKVTEAALIVNPFLIKILLRMFNDRSLHRSSSSLPAPGFPAFYIQSMRSMIYVIYYIVHFLQKQLRNFLAVFATITVMFVRLIELLDVTLTSLWKQFCQMFCLWAVEHKLRDAPSSLFRTTFLLQSQD